MKFQGFIGPAYKLNSVNVDAQRAVNIFPEIIESGAGKEAQRYYYKSTPGLTRLFQVGGGPIRLIHFDGLKRDDGSYTQLNRIFVVSGPEVYRFQYDPTSGWNYVLLGNLGTSTGPVSAASLSQDYGVTVFVDGSAENYVYRKTTTTTETFQTFTAAGFSPVARATQVLWLDGYFIFIVKDTNQFYVSDWASLSVSALSFASAEGDPDNIIAVISNHRDLWLLNERSVEIFANTGNADFPFERVQGGFIENGCAAAFSVAKIGGTVFWLGRDANGTGIVNAARSAQHERISTYAIEQAISSYADISTARAYTYQDEGHSFYVLNFAEATWVYDLSTNLWHERAYTGISGLQRHRVECLAYFPDLNIHFCGDYQNSNIYQLDNSVYTDDGNLITRLRASPHVSSGLNYIFYSQFQLDMETGVGLDGTQQGTDPQIMLRFSDDGGHTWSNEKWVSAGKIGKYKTRAIWRRLGRSRDRIFEIKMTDPVKCVFIGAELQIEQGLE